MAVPADEWAAFTPQVLADGTQPTPAQSATARSLAPYREPKQPAGAPTNPSYDTATKVGGPDISHVTQGGQLVTPEDADAAWADFKPRYRGQLGLLPQTPAMRAAIAADAARPADAIDPGSLNVVDGWTLGRGPEFDAAGNYVDTAINNAIGRMTGKKPAYGASDAYSATRAADADRLDAWKAAHPYQALVTSGVGAAENPLSMLGGAWVAEAAPGAGLTQNLIRSTAKSGVLGAGEGAAFGSSDRKDPVGGAVRGGIIGGATGLAAAPVTLGVAGTVRAGVNGARALADGPLALLGDQTRGMTLAQMIDTQARRVYAANRGVDLSLPEAVQQATGGATSAGRGLRVLEGTRQGQSILAPYFADRPAQLRGAVTNFADQVAPPTNFPSALGPRAKQAAQNGLDQIRDWINQQAEPHYGRLPGTTLSADDYATFSADPAYQRALREVRGDDILNSNIAHLPDNDLSVVNEVVKQLDRNGTASAQTVNNPNGNNYVASRFGAARQQADRVASATSQDWRDARDIGAQGRDWLHEPVQAGPVGTAASSGDTKATVGALYPRHPLAGAPAETEVGMGILNQQSPGLGGDLTRQHVLMSLDGSRPTTQYGENPYVGANFAHVIAGSPEQEATLMAGVRNSGPRGEALADELANTLEMLRATGKREPAGSRTAYNAEDMQQLHTARLGQILKRIGDPLEWGAGVGDLLNGMAWRRNVQGLSGYYTSPADQTLALLMRARRAATPRLDRVYLPQLSYPAVGAFGQPEPSAATGN